MLSLLILSWSPATLENEPSLTPFRALQLMGTTPQQSCVLGDDKHAPEGQVATKWQQTLFPTSGALDKPPGGLLCFKHFLIAADVARRRTQHRADPCIGQIHI